MFLNPFEGALLCTVKIEKAQEEVMNSSNAEPAGALKKVAKSGSVQRPPKQDGSDAPPYKLEPHTLDLVGPTL